MRKSIYIQCIAQAGCFVPAKYAKVSIRDKIIMREKGTGDDISAFQQDCISANETTPNNKEYQLIAMDETFTSTEKKGGEALTAGIINHTLDQKNSLLIISSHYINLHKNNLKNNKVKFNHFDFEIGSNRDNDGIYLNFNHKKLPGQLNNYTYAIIFAESEKFDTEIIQYAKERLKEKI